MGLGRKSIDGVGAGSASVAAGVGVGSSTTIAVGVAVAVAVGIGVAVTVHVAAGAAGRWARLRTCLLLDGRRSESLGVMPGAAVVSGGGSRARQRRARVHRGLDVGVGSAVCTGSSGSPLA